MTRRTHRGERAAGSEPRWAAWRVGWERLLADVLGWGGSGQGALYDALDGGDEFEAPWTRQELDALWASVHTEGTVTPADDRRAVG